MNDRCQLGCPLRTLDGRQAAEFLDLLLALSECVQATKEKELIEYWEMTFPDDEPVPSPAEFDTNIPF